MLRLAESAGPLVRLKLWTDACGLSLRVMIGDSPTARLELEAATALWAEIVPESLLLHSYIQCPYTACALDGV